MLGVYQVQFSNSSNVYSYKKYKVKKYNAVGNVSIDSNIVFYKGRKQTDIELLIKYENGNYFLKPVLLLVAVSSYLMWYHLLKKKSQN